MLNRKQKKILINSLPEDWKQQGADHFNKSINFIEKIAYGITENLEVFEWLVELAEDNKTKTEEKKQQLKSRIQNLAKPATA